MLLDGAPHLPRRLQFIHNVERLAISPDYHARYLEGWL